MMQGLQPGGGIDDHHAARVIQQRGQVLVMDVEHPLADTIGLRHPPDVARMVAVATVVGMMLEHQQRVGRGMAGEGRDDFGDETLHAVCAVIAVVAYLAVATHLQGHQVEGAAMPRNQALLHPPLADLVIRLAHV